MEYISKTPFSFRTSLISIEITQGNQGLLDILLVAFSPTKSLGLVFLRKEYSRRQMSNTVASMNYFLNKAQSNDCVTLYWVVYVELGYGSRF